MAQAMDTLTLVVLNLTDMWLGHRVTGAVARYQLVPFSVA